MYSHFVEGIFAPISNAAPPPKNHSTPSEPAKGLGGLLDRLLKQFSPGQLDLGDLLLLLIILLLFVEGDNLELVITLGLMFLLGLNDHHPTA